MSTPEIKLSKRAVAAILRQYKWGGVAAVPKLAKCYGVKPSYIETLVLVHGVRVKFPRHGKKVRERTDNDPRWAWAIERGPILA